MEKSKKVRSAYLQLMQRGKFCVPKMYNMIVYSNDYDIYIILFTVTSQLNRQMTNNIAT